MDEKLKAKMDECDALRQRLQFAYRLFMAYEAKLDDYERYLMTGQTEKADRARDEMQELAGDINKVNLCL